MDFTLDPAQQAVADVVTAVLERDNSWGALVAGGVTALPVPERLGGDGVGLPEVATALTEIGRHGAITPALATLGLGVVPLLDLATDVQQDRYLARVAKGAVLTAALNEPGAPLPDRPATTLTNNRLSGTKIGVSYAEQAEWMIVTADNAVVVVSPKAQGVQLTKTPTSNDSDEYVVTFSDAEVDGVLDGAAESATSNNGAAAASRQSTGAGDDRRVRGGSGGRGAAADRRLRREPASVRQAAFDVSDGGRATGRGLHRLADNHFGVDIGGVAAVTGP